jgi:hypothetical protein
MAKTIKNAEKAATRGNAAISYGLVAVAKIFIKRSIELDRNMKDEFIVKITQREIQSKEYDIAQAARKQKNSDDFKASRSGESELDKDGLFYQVGMAVKHKQDSSPEVKSFRAVFHKALQTITNQQHVFIKPHSFDEKKGILYVQVSPNFTYPKKELKRAYAAYPKVFAEFLNKAFGSGSAKKITKPTRGVAITKDFNYKKFLMAALKAHKAVYGDK